jgi:hypothetical protein
MDVDFADQVYPVANTIKNLPGYGLSRAVTGFSNELLV